MSRRHAAALALVGWYLMVVPPRIEDGRFAGLDFSAPLSIWTQVGSYKTVAQCNVGMERYPRMLANSNVEPDYRDALLNSSAALRCVSSDDPRLAR